MSRFKYKRKSRRKIEPDKFKRLRIKISKLFFVFSIFLSIVCFIGYFEYKYFFLFILASFFVLFGIILLILMYYDYRLIHRYYSLDEIRKMDPFRFERYVTDILKHYGFRCKTTKERADGGIDIVGNKGGKKMFAQVKRYGKNNLRCRGGGIRSQQPVTLDRAKAHRCRARCDVCRVSKITSVSETIFRRARQRDIRPVFCLCGW